MDAIRKVWRKAIYNVGFAYWTAPLWIGWVARRLSGSPAGKPVPPSQLDRLDTGVSPLNREPKRADAAIRLVSWNICYGCKLDRILRVMREELKADIYLLQEVDCNCGRSGHLHVARTLARELSYNHVFAVEFQELAQSGKDGPAFHGQAILSRFEIRRPRLLRFRLQPADWSEDAFQPRVGGRIALAAEIAIGERSIVVYNAHLENRCREEDRVLQFRELLEDANSLGSELPILIGGDLNTVAHRGGQVSPVLEEAKRAGFPMAFHRCKGDRRTGRMVALDWILARGMGGISEIPRSGRHASDHGPVCVDFALPPTGLDAVGPVDPGPRG